ncbi:MAG TPA: monofunctional biosynthetic peptidoglycan transglycosylase [Woeseiaceae bacterium]|nr:monofunctional biosynthetic peptidoglycan transglycosylase [Woeseiaceae bacterium]
MHGKHPKPGLLRRLMRITAIVVIALILLSVVLVLPLRWIDPPTSSFMLQDDSGRVPVVFDWTDWTALGDAAALAVVAAEDQKFARHFGFDFDSIQASVMQYREGASLRGASTITQQVAKNLYLWPGRSLVRKGMEAWLALVIEAFLPKCRILEVYLNVAELGPGIYGVPAASRYYFGKPPAELTDAEAALLAATLPNPAVLRADRPSDYLRERQAWIYENMQRLRREAWLTLL